MEDRVYRVALLHHWHCCTALYCTVQGEQATEPVVVRRMESTHWGHPSIWQTCSRWVISIILTWSSSVTPGSVWCHRCSQRIGWQSCVGAAIWWQVAWLPLCPGVLQATTSILRLVTQDTKPEKTINDIAWLQVIFMVKVQISNAGGEEVEVWEQCRTGTHYSPLTSSVLWVDSTLTAGAGSQNSQNIMAHVSLFRSLTV